MDLKIAVGSEGNIRLEMGEITKLGDTRSPGGATSIFTPGSSIETTVSINRDPRRMPVPEKRLTLFALRLAVLEKTATRLGALAFIWATVVLLGGFEETLDGTDFWVINVILLVEGTRIFGRSQELEWQHQITSPVTSDARTNNYGTVTARLRFLIRTVRVILRPIYGALRKKNQHGSEIMGRNKGLESPITISNRRRVSSVPTRAWESSDVPLLPYGKWVFLSKNISRVLYWLQLASAAACISLSSVKLIQHSYGNDGTAKGNRKSALNIFYSLALAEALLFLLEKAYWEWNVSYCKLLEEVNKECELGEAGILSIRRFFYDAFSRCINGSIFDGPKLDLVSFAMDLLGSNTPDEQLIGVRILRQFSLTREYSDDTLRKIGISLSVIERLVEMLNWKDPLEEEIRQSAAEILSKLASKKQNSLRVSGIPGAMESISSLLYNSRNSSYATDEIYEKKLSSEHNTYGYYTFNHLGLTILKKFARDLDNCQKIGNTRGLLPKIIDFTHVGERLLKDENVTASQILAVKRSLQVVKMLAGTYGSTGRELRKEISEIVFTVSNIRDILRHGQRYPMLQKLGAEILTSLAMEGDATERIGGTGGVLKQLFNIFFNKEIPENEKELKIAAGEALAMLALESKNNCQRILRLKMMDKLVGALEDHLLRINAARVLRNLCTYSGEDCFNQLKEVTAAMPTVLKTILSEENKLQEVMVGLAAEVFKFLSSEESSIMFERAGIKEADLANTLVEILKKFQHPPTKIPRIRRFAIELAVCMMKDKQTNVQIFKNLGMDHELERVTDTVVEHESFNIFSGTVGMSRHGTTMHSLVETALKFLEAE